MRVALLVLALAVAGTARADEASRCARSSGTFLTGTVISTPRFAHGHTRNGVELSHTRLTLRADQDGRPYDVAIDNVFALGYDAAGETIPTPVSSIKLGDRLELCGKLYTQGGLGIDWVHGNCGAVPSSKAPDGWVKEIDASGTPGLNLGNSAEYCSLWR
jgi:hypothetical protein